MKESETLRKELEKRGMSIDSIRRTRALLMARGGRNPAARKLFGLMSDDDRKTLLLWLADEEKRLKK